MRDWVRKMQGLCFKKLAVSMDILESPVPGRVQLDRFGYGLEPGVKKKSLVQAGAILAVSPSVNHGDLYAPISGEVTELTDDIIVITAAELPDDGDVVRAEDLPVGALEDARLYGPPLAAALKGFGVDAGPLAEECETLVINGLDPDPGIAWAVPLMTSQKDCLTAGFALLRRLAGAANLVLAVPEGFDVAFDGVTVRNVSPAYPDVLDPLVIRAITGLESPRGVRAASLHTIWGLGRVATTGRPLTETVLTISDGITTKNIIAHDGYLAADLVRLAGLSLKEGDALLHDGAMRGTALPSLEWGVRKTTTGLFVLDKKDVIPLDGDNPCVNCGACVSVCPARLEPGRLSRYAEFGLYDKCRDNGIGFCMSCGLCSYVCVARRPVLQYLQIARGISI